MVVCLKFVQHNVVHLTPNVFYGVKVGGIWGLVQHLNILVGQFRFYHITIPPYRSVAWFREKVTLMRGGTEATLG